MFAERSATSAGLQVIFFNVITFGAFVVIVMHRLALSGGMERSYFHSAPFPLIWRTLLTQVGILGNVKG